MPTIAIEKVHFYLNTSVFQEEFLAHRLGLIPIKAEAKQFEYPENGKDTLRNTFTNSSLVNFILTLVLSCTTQ